MFTKIKNALCLAILLSGYQIVSPGYALASTLSIYLSPPRVQESSVEEAVVETFNDKKPGALEAEGKFAIGTYNNQSLGASILEGSITGGARSSRYLYSGPISISIDSSAGYVGFWLATIDGDNQVELYDTSANLIATISGKGIDSYLASHKSVTDQEGVSYSASEYKGNPNVNPEQDTSPQKRQNYVYVNAFVDGSERIGSMVIRNSSIEIDNISIAYRSISPDKRLIHVGDFEF